MPPPIRHTPYAIRHTPYAIRHTPYAIRHTLVVLLVAVTATWSLGQEIPLQKPDVDRLAKLAVVTFTGPKSIKLSIPGGFMGDPIEGRILLVNDSGTTASISEIKTSCGCTSAIPIERSVSDGKRNLLLLTYEPKAPGTQKIEAHFEFGGKEFWLHGVAETRPRFQATKSALEFDENGRAVIELRKLVPTPVDRLVVLPSTFSIESFEESADFVRGKLVRDPQRNWTDVNVIPVFKTDEHSSLGFELRYPGVVEVVPRRVIVSDEEATFYLRGDVLPLDGAKELTLTENHMEYVLPCDVGLNGTVLRVSFKTPFAAGDYSATIKIKDSTFPLLLTVR